jgi:hypothetical protein
MLRMNWPAENVSTDESIIIWHISASGLAGNEGGGTSHRHAASQGMPE